MACFPLQQLSLFQKSRGVGVVDGWRCAKMCAGLAPETEKFWGL